MAICGSARSSRSATAAWSPIAALVALGWEDQLNSHIGRGLGNGLTREEIAEIITHLSMYAGWPAAMTASHVAVDVFDEQDKAKG